MAACSLEDNLLQDRHERDPHDLRLSVAREPGPVQSEAQKNMPVYTDSLQNGWENWSWASTSNSTRSSTVARRLSRITVDAWRPLLHHSAIDTTWFTNLAVFGFTGHNGGQRLRVAGLVAAANSQSTISGIGDEHLAAVHRPAAGAAWTAPRLRRLLGSGPYRRAQATFCLDDLTLIGATPPSPGDDTPRDHCRGRAARPASDQPLIYGVAFATSSHSASECPLNRSGGNGIALNWQLTRTITPRLVL